MEYLSSIDINLVPLLKDEFNECKSAIRYLEASLLGIPTIVTAVGDFKNVVSHGETGFLVEEEGDWVVFLERLIQSSSLRQEVGDSARDVVLRKYAIMEEQYLGQIDMNVLKVINGS
jgi:glycosyltransferase involved in cell wall biosynthesis